MYTDPSQPDLLNKLRSPIYLLLLLIFPVLLLAACFPQAITSPTPSVSPALTATPQAAALTAPAPTTTALTPNHSNLSTRPTPELLDTPTESPVGTPILGEIPSDLLQALLADLSGRLGIPVERISVIQAQSVEWNDSSLGCPQPGLNYLQVITPGFRVVLSAQDHFYDYHTDTNAKFILCNPDGLIKDPPPLLPILPGNKLPKCKWPPCK